MADKLYTKQGVLLTELVWFVTTADYTVDVIHTDKITNSGHIRDCSGKISISLRLKKKYSMLWQ